MNRPPRPPQAWSRLGTALRHARERADLTQEQLATRAGVSKFSVQSAEAGTVPKRRMPYTLAKIAQALEWPAAAIDTVLDGGEPPGQWRDIPVPLPGDRIAAAFTDAMLRGTDTMTTAEIRTVIDDALAQLRAEGLIDEPNMPKRDLRDA